MKMTSPFMLLSITLMSYSSLNIAATDEPQPEKANGNVPCHLPTGPRMVGGKISFRAASQRAWKVHVEPLH